MSDWRNDIERYKRGELTPAEMHDLERRALYDPMLADALEGIESVTADELSRDLADLKRSVERKPARWFTPLRIAAGVVLLMASGVAIFWPSNDPTSVALTKADSTLVPPDTTKSNTSASAAELKEQLTMTEQPKADRTSAAGTSSRKRIAAEREDATDQNRAGDTFAFTPNLNDSTLRLPTVVAVQPFTITTESVTQAAPTAAQGSADTVALNKITGTVTTAEDGLPLPGVNVTLKGAAIGTTTDINGNYTLDAPPNSSLVFSFVGMETREVTVANSEKVNIKLAEDATQLSEVVITRKAVPAPNADGPIVKLAQPVGGIKAYDKYMEDNLRYPQQALDNNIKGRVVVEFDVGVDGDISNFVVMRSLGYGCDDEVIRLVKEGPRWMPTTEDEVPVESSVRVRMKFDPAKAKKKK